MSATWHRSNLKVLPTHRVSPLRDAYDAFLLSLRASHRTPRTIGFYGEKLGPFVDWLEDHAILAPQDLTASHIRRFLIEREEAGRAPRTVHHHAAAIKAWLNWCVTEELLTDSPMKKVKMPKVDDPIFPAFTAEDIDGLF